MISQFEAPIPGESLTTTPRNYPWENPPEISDPEEAIQMYLTKITDSPDVLEDIFTLLEAGLTVREFTSGLLRIGVSGGVHSIDVGLIIAPVIHQFIKVMATESGVKFEDGFSDDKLSEEKTFVIAKEMAKLELFEDEEETMENLEEMEAPMEEEVEMPEEKPQGLMARR